MANTNFLINRSINSISFSLSLFIAYSYLYFYFVYFEIDSESGYLFLELIVLFLITLLLFLFFLWRLKILLASEEDIYKSYSLVSIIFLIGALLIIFIDFHYALSNSAEYGDLDTDVIRNDKVIHFNKFIYPLALVTGVITFLLNQLISLRKK